jgi:hypothetical protein
MGPIAIPEILKVASQPGIVSLAGGLPASETGVAGFPGNYFFTEPGGGKNTLRINFTNSDAATLHIALALPCSVLVDAISDLQPPAKAAIYHG